MEHLDHPSTHFNDAKMARFCFAPSSLLWGGWGIIVPFYSVQDCRFQSKEYSQVFKTISTAFKQQPKNSLPDGLNKLGLKVLVKDYAVFNCWMLGGKGLC